MSPMIHDASEAPDADMFDKELAKHEVEDFLNQEFPPEGNNL